MKNKYHYILLFIISIYFSIKVKCDVDVNNQSLNTNFSLKAYTKEDILIQELELTYDYNNKIFFNYLNILLIENAKYFILCSRDYLDKNDDEINMIVLWNTSNIHDFYSTTAYLNAYPMWLKSQKKKFCLKVESVGWIDNVEAKICKNVTENYTSGKNIESTKNTILPCPDLIILGTTQLSNRYYKKETLSLNKFFTRYFKNHGKSLESKMNKYSHFDYRINNDWLAVPLMTDIRTFRFNKTTFDICKKKGYNLHYPPPYNRKDWGTDYTKTWTWEKAFEYAEMISECTGSPGFKILGEKSEDTKFFIIICQSLGIPFFIDDYERDIKKCGLRKDDYIEKLSIVKKLFENHYIEKWLVEDDVIKWKNNPYPESLDKQPVFHLMEQNYGKFGVNGILFDIISRSEFEKDVLRSYIPGSSSFLGGSGIAVTSKTKFPDELFDYIEVLIDEENPYLQNLNSAITPYDNIKGSICDSSRKSNQELCNELLSEQGVVPYYYIYNNELKIVYMRHITNTEDKSFSLSAKNYISGDKSELNLLFPAQKYTCGKSVDYFSNTITFYEPYKIIFPISHNETIILKSMSDYKEEDDRQQVNYMTCNIFDEAYTKAKPMQFPYNTFSELSNFEVKSPVSLLLAHLYYKHNETNEGSFKDIINECCDIVDASLIPSCSNVTKIKFKVGECQESIKKVRINYLNCFNDKNLPLLVDCSYIPVTYSLGLMIQIYIATAYIIEFFYLFILIKLRNKRSIILSGFEFLISIVLSSVILLSSVLFWIGKYSKFKCILKIWSVIIGVTGFICSYSIKSYVIMAIYNNKKLTKAPKSYECYILYSVIFIVQIILLIIWSFTQNGVVMKQHYLENVGNYELETCSNGNSYILSAMFIVDFGLMVISIVMAYQGRKIPAEFNYSKKILITSLISGLMLLFCYLIVVGDFGKNILYFSLSILIITITLIINGIFIGSKLLSIFNINFTAPTFMTSNNITSISTDNHNINNFSNVNNNYKNFTRLSDSSSHSH